MKQFSRIGALLYHIVIILFANITRKYNNRR